MSDPLRLVRTTVEAALFGLPRKTEGELRTMIQDMAILLKVTLNESEIEQIAREIEFKQGIKAGLGAIVDSDDYQPWLDDAKSSIIPFYWDRYRGLLLQYGLPKDVVIAMDNVTDKVLNRLGNPKKQFQWDRRGMVVGHVQSGKTANYTGLICKAGDAGYRLIIVIAGIHNNLRNQTQARIDEGFIGRDTGRSQNTKRGGARHTIGVGLIDPRHTPVSLTNTLWDFNKATASTNTSEIDSYKVPVILVVKKNYRTLGNLLDWLKDNSARGDDEMIDQPMLLIDDEADNASINTKYSKELVTTINGQIRDLLNTFHRSCYVGYTATPFANIFIDPDDTDEMYNEDLFPRDFIFGLDPPSNYFGASRVFVDGLPDEGTATWLRYISDNEDILPIKHKIDHNLEALPISLTQALRTFLLARTIRNLRGHHASHCSMLVNASRFTAVQTRLRNRLHEKLEQIQNAVRINASKGSDALRDFEIAALYTTWQEEYAEAEPDWARIQSNLLDAIASAKIVEVNSRVNDLDYAGSVERGQTVVAVGGFSLSRGLTLEGLTVTWFLRNTLMYDTLMQMGRWFGYRDDYEDLCRIWMPVDAIDWYAFIANAAEELHDELHTMEKAKATPQQFGLAVRGHPASLLVTARNKMGSGRKVTMRVGLSNKFVETSRVSIRSEDLAANIQLAQRLIHDLEIGCFEECAASSGPCKLRVPVDIVDQFLAGWRNSEQSVRSDPGPIRQYIRARSKDELSLWDVLIVGKKRGESVDILGRPLIPITRSIDPRKLRDGVIPFGGNRMRVADASFESAGLTEQEIALAEEQYRTRSHVSGARPSYPGSIYRSVRARPLFMLMLVRPIPTKGTESKNEVDLIPTDPVVAWGMSLPKSNRPTERVEYVVNTVRHRELFGEDDEDEDQEDILHDS